jgi:hypothetical protein
MHAKKNKSLVWQFAQIDEMHAPLNFHCLKKNFSQD